MTSFVILMMSRVFCARSPRSHYDVILIVTSFTTELATPTVTDVRTLHTDTLPRLIYRDVVSIPSSLGTVNVLRGNVYLFYYVEHFLFMRFLYFTFSGIYIAFSLL